MEVYPGSLGELCNSLDASLHHDRDPNSEAEALIVGRPSVRRLLDDRRLSQITTDRV